MDVVFHSKIERAWTSNNFSQLYKKTKLLTKSLFRVRFQAMFLQSWRFAPPRRCVRFHKTFDPPELISHVPQRCCTKTSRAAAAAVCSNAHGSVQASTFFPPTLKLSFFAEKAPRLDEVALENTLERAATFWYIFFISTRLLKSEHVVRRKASEKLPDPHPGPHPEGLVPAAWLLQPDPRGDPLLHHARR